MDREVEQHIVKEMWGASYIVVWCMATTTDGFRQDNLSVATQDSMGVQFLKQVVDASMRLHKYRYEHREVCFKEQYPNFHSIKLWLHDLRESKNRGQKGEEEEEEQEPEVTDDEADSDEADWSKDDDESDWEERLQDTPPADQQPDLPDEDLEWGLQDDLLLTS